MVKEKKKNRVLELRKSKGMSQMFISVEAGMGMSMLTSIEKYGYRPGPDVRQRIADVLGEPEREVFPQ